MNIAGAHADLTIVCQLFIPVFLCLFRVYLYMCKILQVELSQLGLYHTWSHPAFQSLTVFKWLTLCVTVFTYYSGLYLYVFKLFQEDFSLVYFIILVTSGANITFSFIKLVSDSVIWKLFMCLTVPWIYHEIYHFM